MNWMVVLIFTDLLLQYYCISSGMAVHGGNGITGFVGGGTMALEVHLSVHIQFCRSAALLDTGVPRYVRLMDREIDWVYRI
jgi:hypothetical protein